MSRFTSPLVATLLFCAAAVFDLAGADTGSGELADFHHREPASSGHRPWVWELAGAHSKVWIAGCLHLGATRDSAAFPAYQPYYRNAEVIYFETVPGAWNSFEVKKLLDRRGFLPDRQSLSSKISSVTWLELQASLANDPARLAKISRMEPWLAAFNLTQDAYARAGLRAADSLQGYIERRTAEDRKPAGSLETPKDQILAMADAAGADQEAFLRDTIRSLNQVGSQTQRLREAWLSGDELTLQNRLGLTATLQRSGMHQNLIGARNKRWVRKIKEIEATGKNSLVLVGVEHLVSTPYALPDLLEQAGFSVRRVGR